MSSISSQIAAAIVAGAVLLSSAFRLSASTLEEGITDLARQIVDKSLASETTTLAIAAFPHADDSCSEMSNYLVDELVLSLFTVQSGQLEIIERSQLERIFAELQLSMTGAIDANTTQELGRIHGVDALLIGSLTLVGEALRVNSRLIDTETGRVFSAAAVSIPKTATIDELMSVPAIGGCTLSAAATSSAGETGHSMATSDQTLTEQADGSLKPSTDLVVNNGIGARILFLGAEKEGWLTLSVLLSNQRDEDVYLAVIPPKPSVVTSNGGTLKLQDISGASSCRVTSSSECMSNYMGYLPGSSFALLEPSSSLALALTFWGDDVGDANFASASLSFAMGKGERPSEEKGNIRPLENITISFPVIPIGDSE